MRPQASRKKVLHTAAVVGALVLARATSDDKLGAEIMKAGTGETLSG